MLTQRGKEVFKLCLDGRSTKEISTILNIGISGVRRHKEKMLLDNKCESMRQLFSLYYISNKLNPVENNTV